jgi:hypothetical protein
LWPALAMGEMITSFIGNHNVTIPSFFGVFSNVGGVYLVAVLLERFRKPFTMTTIHHFN